MGAMRNRNAPHIDFKDLMGVIPENPKFLPSNLDMVYERKGWFLVCEWKRPNEKVSTGQEILLRRLCATPKFCVLLVTGNTDADMQVTDIRLVAKTGELVSVGSSLDDLKNFIRAWYKHVNDNQ